MHRKLIVIAVALVLVACRDPNASEIEPKSAKVSATEVLTDLNDAVDREFGQAVPSIVPAGRGFRVTVLASREERVRVQDFVRHWLPRVEGVQSVEKNEESASAKRALAWLSGLALESGYPAKLSIAELRRAMFEVDVHALALAGPEPIASIEREKWLERVASQAGAAPFDSVPESAQARDSATAYARQITAALALLEIGSERSAAMASILSARQTALPLLDPAFEAARSVASEVEMPSSAVDLPDLLDAARTENARAERAFAPIRARLALPPSDRIDLAQWVTADPAFTARVGEDALAEIERQAQHSEGWLAALLASMSGKAADVEVVDAGSILRSVGVKVLLVPAQTRALDKHLLLVDKDALSEMPAWQSAALVMDAAVGDCLRRLTAQAHCVAERIRLAESGVVIRTESSDLRLAVGVHLRQREWIALARRNYGVASESSSLETNAPSLGLMANRELWADVLEQLIATES